MGQKNIPEMSRQSVVDDAGVDDDQSPPSPEKTPFILVLTRNGHMAESVMNYVVNVADHLKYRILAVHINTLPFFRDGGKRNSLFAAAMQESALLLIQKAGDRGVLVEHLGELGKIGKVVTRLCHSEKRIEFVVIDQGIRMEEVVSQSPVPVFSVIYTSTKTDQINKATYCQPREKGESGMSTTSRKRHVKNCFVFGALTAGLYAAVFTNQAFVMTYFAKGGLYALLPVAVVFAVSYVHGNFTSSFWSALGIEGSKNIASKTTDIRQEVPVSVDIRKDNRPRVQVSV